MKWLKYLPYNNGINIQSNQSKIKDSLKSDAENKIYPIIAELYFVLRKYLIEKTGIYVFPFMTGKLMSHKAFSCFWD